MMPRIRRLIAVLALTASLAVALSTALADAAVPPDYVPGTNHLSGTIRNQAGVPLAGITVTVWWVSSGPQWWTVKSVGRSTSTLDGTYDVGGLSAGTYDVALSDDAGAFCDKGYPDVAVPGLLDAVLVPAGGITGRVTRPDGTPAGGIDVTALGHGSPPNDFGWPPTPMPYRPYVPAAHWPAGEAETASDGTYRIGGLTPGDYLVSFHVWSPTLAFQFYDGASGSTLAIMAIEVVVAGGETRAGIDTTFTAGEASPSPTPTPTPTPTARLSIYTTVMVSPDRKDFTVYGYAVPNPGMVGQFVRVQVLRPGSHTWSTLKIIRLRALNNGRPYYSYRFVHRKTTSDGSYWFRALYPAGKYGGGRSPSKRVIIR